MTLRHEPDLGAADWITTDPSDARIVARQGPSGFAAYATVWFDDAADDGYRSDPDIVALLTRLAAARTGASDRARFALWDGWGEIEEGRFYGVMDVERGFGRVFSGAPARIAPPAFDDSVLAAPRMTLDEDRSYLLFTGSPDDVGEWGARPLAPTWPRELPQAAFTWPDDRTWCIASDVETSWCCVGGRVDVIEEILGQEALRSEPAVHGVMPSSQA